MNQKECSRLSSLVQEQNLRRETFVDSSAITHNEDKGLGESIVGMKGSPGPINTISMEHT